MEIKIESGIPVPGHKNGKKLKSKLPFASLKVGQSFKVPAKTRKSKQTVASSASYAAKKLGFKFAGRSVRGGYRVWRVK